MKIDGVSSAINNVGASYGSEVRNVQSTPDISTNISSGAEIAPVNKIAEKNQKNAP